MSTKDELLAYLREKEGGWVSGAALSRRLSLTRSAVWKQACNLREEGYGIESSPRKGYLLRETPDRVSPQEIRRGLKTKIFGQREIVYPEKTASTNTRAKALAADGSPEGTLVVAEEQTRGRGRRDRAWYSPGREGIYVSLILRPRVSPAHAAQVPILASVALAESLLSLGPFQVKVKWPNDVLVNGKKVAGTLVEMAADLDTVDFMVLGTGLNVNTSVFPQDLKGSATSLFLETGRVLSRTEILRSYLESLEEAYGAFQQGRGSQVFGRWKALTDIVGREVTIDLADGTCSGQVQDLDADGALILRDHRGELHRVLSGDVHQTVSGER